MDEARFWSVIDEACRPARDEPEAWDERLTEVLSKLPPDEVVAWGRRFDELTAAAYRWDLWGATYLINGGASDDGFYYFRCWLVGMGREVYEAALADPDTLADVVEPGPEYEAETYGAARAAWARATGEGEDDFPAEPAEAPDEPAGEQWDFDDDEENRRRLPRLAELTDEGERADRALGIVSTAPPRLSSKAPLTTLRRSGRRRSRWFGIDGSSSARRRRARCWPRASPRRGPARASSSAGARRATARSW